MYWTNFDEFMKSSLMVEKLNCNRNVTQEVASTEEECFIIIILCTVYLQRLGDFTYWRTLYAPSTKAKKKKRLTAC